MPAAGRHSLLADGPRDAVARRRRLEHRAGYRRAVANSTFSACAALGSLAVSVLAAARGALAVAIVFGALALGFVARAAERYWRGER